MLLLGALVVDVALFTLLGRPEFGERDIPLSELVVPGVPYPLFESFVSFAGPAVLPWPPAPPAACAYAPPDKASAATAAMSVLVAFFMIRSSLIELESRRRRSPSA